MVDFNQLEQFLKQTLIYSQTLNTSHIDPFMANGLVYKGEEKISKVGLAVSASIELFKKTVEANCQALIIHHAFDFPSRVKYDFLFQNRYSYLVKNNLSLFGYHFLLDSHPVFGHNVLIIKEIGGVVEKPFLHRGDPWGFFGKVNNLSLTEVVNKLRPKLSPKMTLYDFGQKKLIR